jgi:hypothetical protein
MEKDRGGARAEFQIRVAEGKVEWQDGSSVKNCLKCEKRFTISLRKHHCRACGKVVCGYCSGKKKELPESFGHGKRAERVCDDCYHYLVELEYEKSEVKVQKPDYLVVEKALTEKIAAILGKEEGHWKKTKEAKGVSIEILEM